MEKLKARIAEALRRPVVQQDLAQELNRASGGSLYDAGAVPLLRRAAAEGVVLLKNNAVLPLKQEDCVAVFGRCAVDTFAVGYGSGGDVQTPYKVNIMEGLAGQNVSVNKKLEQAYKLWLKNPKNTPNEGTWGNWPMSFPEMPLSRSLVQDAAQNSTHALVVIGRAAGEARENTLTRGSFYLTKAEEKMLRLVTETFDKVIVLLNCGNIIDLNWVGDYGNKISAILYAWQGGMETGNGIADILTGRINPSGKLADTLAHTYQDYPSSGNFGHEDYNNYAEDIYVGYRFFETFASKKVLFPFGFGLSYTNFSLESTARMENRICHIQANLRNTGGRAGKETVQVYLALPQGVLGKPKRVLAAFAKSKELAPGETQELTLRFSLDDFASYDDSGKTGHPYCMILEDGVYRVYVGTHVRAADCVLKARLTQTTVVQKLRQLMAPAPGTEFSRLVRIKGQIGPRKAAWETVPTAKESIRQRILDELPGEIAPRSGQDIKLAEVARGEYSLEDFIAGLSPVEMEQLTRGEGKMDSPLGAAGNAGAFGGVSAALRQKGVAPVITTDGPSGVRVKQTVMLLPCETAFACSFDPELVQNVYAAVAREACFHGSHVLLAPGMNIHRDPLCGRNFEYFSEDPLLTGTMAAAVVRGLQENGVSAAPKHFACNNQESNRHRNDSRVSERALREIYLRGFEIMVRDSHPHMIMTSYNKINGVWSHYNYELCISLLRGEWGYDGLIITDWWMQAAASPEFPEFSNDAYRLRAGVDVLMPGGDGFDPGSKVGRNLLDEEGNIRALTLGELQRSCANVLRYCIKAGRYDDN